MELEERLRQPTKHTWAEVRETCGKPQNLFLDFLSYTSAFYFPDILSLPLYIFHKTMPLSSYILTSIFHHHGLTFFTTGQKKEKKQQNIRTVKLANKSSINSSFSFFH